MRLCVDELESELAQLRAGLPTSSVDASTQTEDDEPFEEPYSGTADSSAAASHDADAEGSDAAAMAPEERMVAQLARQQ